MKAVFKICCSTSSSSSTALLALEVVASPLVVLTSAAAAAVVSIASPGPIFTLPISDESRVVGKVSRLTSSLPLRT